MFHIIVPAWGEPYFTNFRRYLLPSFFASGNIPYLVQAGRDVAVSVLSTRDQIDEIESDPLVRRLKSVAQVNLVDASDLIEAAPFLQHGLTWCYQLAMSRERRPHDEVNFVLLTSDNILSASYLKRLAEIDDDGFRAVMTCALRTVIETVGPAVETYRTADGAIEIESLDLLRLSIDHLHPMDQANFVERQDICNPHAHYRHMVAGGKGIVARSYVWHPVMVRPIGRIYAFRSPFDYELAEYYVGRPDLYYFANGATDMYVAELARAEYVEGRADPRPVGRELFAQRLAEWTTAAQRRNVNVPIYWTEDPTDPDVREALDKLDAVMADVAFQVWDIRPDPMAADQHPYWGDEMFWIRHAIPERISRLMPRVQPAMRTEVVRHTGYLARSVGGRYWSRGAVPAERAQPLADIFAFTPVWGDDFVDTYLNVSLPSLLADGNLPALARRCNLVYSVYSNTAHHETIARSPAWRALQRIADCRLVDIDKLDAEMSAYQRMSICYELGVYDNFRHGDDFAFLFLTPDSFWADGSFETVWRYNERGYRAVMYAGLRADKEPFIADVKARTAGDPARTLAPRALMELGLKHLHPIHHSMSLNSSNGTISPAHVYLNVPGEGFVARAFAMHPVFVRPRQLSSIQGARDDRLSTIDHGFIENCGLEFDEVKIIADSDDLLHVDMCAHPHHSDTFTRRRLVEEDMIAWLNTRWCGSFHLQFARHDIYFHAHDIGDQLVRAARRVEEFIESALRRCALVKLFVCVIDQNALTIRDPRVMFRYRYLEASPPNWITADTLFHILLPIWGDAYIAKFFSIGLPSLMAPGNIPSAGAERCVLRVLTKRNSAGKIVPRLWLSGYLDHGTAEILCPEIDFSNPYFAMSACYNFGMALRVSRKTLFIFMTPNSIWNADLFRYLDHQVKQGKRAVLIAGCRAEWTPELAGKIEAYRTEDDAIVIGGRDLFRIGYEHIHAISRGHMMVAGTNKLSAHYYFEVPGEGYLARTFHLHPVMVWPENEGAEIVVGTMLDHDFVRLSCRYETVKIVDNSDEVTGVDLAEPNYMTWPREGSEADFVEQEIAWAQGWTNGLHREYVKTPLYFHVNDLPADPALEGSPWAAVAAEADAFVTKILAGLPPQTPSTAQDIGMLWAGTAEGPGGAASLAAPHAERGGLTELLFRLGAGGAAPVREWRGKRGWVLVRLRRIYRVLFTPIYNRIGALNDAIMASAPLLMQVPNLETTLGRLGGEAVVLSKKLEEVASDVDTKAAAMRSRCEALEAADERLWRDVARIGGQLETRYAHLDAELRQTAERSDAERAEMRDALARIEATLGERTEAALTELQATLANAERAFDGRTRKLEAMHHGLLDRQAALDTTIAGVEREIALVLAEVSRASIEMGRVSGQLGERLARIETDTGARFDEVEQAVARLATEDVRRLTAEMGEASGRFADEIGRLKAALEASRGELETGLKSLQTGEIAPLRQGLQTLEESAARRFERATQAIAAEHRAGETLAIELNVLTRFAGNGITRPYGRAKLAEDAGPSPVCVVANAIPKSGTYLLTLLLDATAQWRRLPIHILDQFYLDRMSDGSTEVVPFPLPDNLDRLKPGQVVPAHILFDARVDGWFAANPGHKHLLMIRDPRDIVVSYTQFVSELEAFRKEAPANATMQEEINRYASFADKMMYILERHELLQVAPFQGWIDAEAVHVVRFEELYRDAIALKEGAFGGTLTRLGNVLAFDFQSLDPKKFAAKFLNKSHTSSGRDRKIAIHEELFEQRHYDAFAECGLLEIARKLGY